MDLDLLFGECLVNLDSCLGVEADIDTKKHDGACVPDQVLFASEGLFC